MKRDRIVVRLFQSLLIGSLEEILKGDFYLRHSPENLAHVDGGMSDHVKHNIHEWI